GAEPLYMGIVPDDYAYLQNTLQNAIENGADLIISSAGVSIGSRDLVRRVLEDMGKIDFWRVRMRPGKPLAYGHVRGVPFFGLPGNPVSSLASFEIFVRPALLKMLGQPWDVQTVDAVLGHDFESDGRESYIRVTLTREGERLIAHSTGTQSSGAISSLVKANGLLVIPAGTTHAAAGEVLPVRPFAGQPIRA
ncbi:MAG: molybdopterin molybdotransferase MoeA, partial [Anaerolineales bacterium]